MKKSQKNSRTRWDSVVKSRALMFATSSLWMAFILVVLVSRWGGTTPVEPELRPAPSSAGLVQQANELAARGEYEAAALGYRAAIERAPDNISLRFALGTVLSHMGRQEETVEQFRWVVTRGNPDSFEVQVARGWLERAGVLAPSVTFAPSKSLEPRTRETQLASTRGSMLFGQIQGRTEWREGGPANAPRRLNVVLEGTDDSNAEVALDTWVTLGEAYEFRSVDPGNYLLTARVSDTVVWEQKVTVEVGKVTVVDLSDANSLVASTGLPDLAGEGR